MIMKKISCLLLSGLLFFAVSAESKGVFDFLENFFFDMDFHTDVYNFSGHKIRYSYLYADASRDIVFQAIIYEIHENMVIPLLVFDKNVIRNSQGVLLIAKPPESQTYFGWEIEINKKNRGVSCGFYTNGGKSVTNGPSFFWDDVDNIYKKYEIDPSIL